MMTTAGVAQAPPAAIASPQLLQHAVAPQAIVAKIALISFEEAVLATNEGQRAVQEIQKKYQPKKAEIDSLSKEVDYSEADSIKVRWLRCLMRTSHHV